MAAQRKFDLMDPFPSTLEKVYEELDYWAGRQNEGEPGSIHEEGVKNRLEHLRDLERRFKESQKQSSDIVFISCGQYTDEEKRLGRQAADLVSELTTFTPYFADFQSSLEALTENILKQLHKCVGFIAIMHPRGEVVFPGGARHTRGSVWIEEEIAIAAFVVQVLNRPLNVAAYIHRSIRREGIRDQLHLNPVFFDKDREVLDSLRNILPTWKDLSTDVVAQVKLDINYKEKKITPGRHDYELAILITNSSTDRIEQYQMDVMFPNAFLEQGTTYALEDTRRRTQTHRFFRWTEQALREPLYPESCITTMIIPYFVDRNIFWDGRLLDQEVSASFYSRGLKPVKTKKSMRELQKF
jgi:hypothetical protein